ATDGSLYPTEPGSARSRIPRRRFYMVNDAGPFFANWVATNPVSNRTATPADATADALQFVVLRQVAT
ncbi:MAG TPA: hypothetical protein VF447_13525, partial [Terriglobales bacterium]